MSSSFTELRLPKARAWLRRRSPLLGALLVAFLILPPLVWLTVAEVRLVFTPNRGADAWLDPISRHLLVRSLGIAAQVMVAAACLGVPYGWLLAKYRLPGRPLLALGSLLPLLLPPYAAALAWTVLLARDSSANRFLLAHGLPHLPALPYGSPAAVVLALAGAYWPITAWFTVFAARSVPGELEDSARLHLPDAAAARWAAGPALARAVPASCLLVFLLSLADFAVPNTLGVSTYPVSIVNQFQLDRDPAVAVRLALPLLALAIPLVAIQLRLLHYTALAPVQGSRSGLVRGDWATGAGWIFAGGLLLGSALLPLLVLGAASLPWRDFTEVWATSAGHFENTLISSTAGAVLAVVAALGYGWATRRRPLPALDLALTCPYALPASLTAVAMIALLNRPGLPGWIYGTQASLVWCYAILYFPFANKTLQPAWGQVSVELLEETGMLGGSAWQQFRAAAWPVVRSPAFAGGAIVMLLSAREIDATALLRVPGGDTLGFRINDYMHFASVHDVAAVCVLLELFSLILFGTVLGLLWKLEA